MVNEYRECSPGVFACGNVLQVHDLVDNVTSESMTAGRYAGLNALGTLNRSEPHSISEGKGVRYTVPSSYYSGDGELEIFFRVLDKHRNADIVVKSSTKEIKRQKTIALNPGEMTSIKISKVDLREDIVVSIEE